MKILITSGATREPIDAVRFITNFSTGSTGANLATFFKENGDDVLLLRGEGSISADVRTLRFSDFQDLNRKLISVLSEEAFDVVVHLAAVSDYSVENPFSGKMDSENELTLKLRKNFKIVERLKNYAKISEPLIVAFKLTSTQDTFERERAVKKISQNVDFVVHNDIQDLKAGRRIFTLYKGTEKIAEMNSADKLAMELRNRIKEKKA